MDKKVEIGGLYKIKSGKKLCKSEEISPFVRLLGYVTNPLEEGKYYALFIYVYKDTLEYVTAIWPERILPYDTFFEYFDLDLTTAAVNKLIYKLETEGK